ncbi:acid phosphatase 1 [Sesamum indicum]|uniref:Acid phosphatase 1 n=1 Tax=Sesamum indicum TaxID=4182 RepID=A0A6I9U3W4_SESIN|nr:acid phosphatase 1 [Sesamum indicum]
MFVSTMPGLREAALVLVFLAICCKAVNSRPFWCPTDTANSSGYCLSWRLAVEANNIRAWRTVPTQCSRHIEAYMIAGQYQRDLNLIVGSICSYVDTITLSDDGFDAWILDVDDTCISNLFYYRGKRYGCEPFDPLGFRAWALQGECAAIPDVLRLFNKLVETGFKVFLVTGRDEETLGQATIQNLENQGFLGYQRLILRSGAYKGVSAITYKSEIRKQLVEEGYRIWGNVGDQWSDVQGDYAGNRTFKLPNPMYFIP